MITDTTQKMIIVLVVVLVLSFFGYKMFLTTPAPAVAGSSTSVVAGQDILVLVAKLNTISINQSIFTSPLFTNLVDFSQPVYPELHGRVNPFAPIGSDINSPNVVIPKQATSTKGV